MRSAAILLLTLLSAGLHAQPVIPRFETLGVDDGLSQSSVYAIYQDRAGYMWFGTADGLNRYDGAEMRVFRSPDALDRPGSSNYVRGNISEDLRGDLWYANETGIYKWDRRGERLTSAYEFPFRQFQNTVFYNVGLHRGQLWLVNFQHGIVSFDPATKQLHQYPIPANFPKQNAPNNNGTLMPNGDILFCINTHDGYVRFRSADHRFVREETGKLMGAVYRGRGSAYFVSEGGFFRYDSGSRKIDWIGCKVNGAPVNSIIDITEDGGGRLWVTTTGSGLLLYRPDQKSWQVFRHDNARQRSLPIDLLRMSYIDRQQNLWVGTDGAGVCRIDLKPPRFALFPQNEGDYPVLKDYFTKCFYEDRKGRVWFGSHNNGFSIYEPKTGALKSWSYDPANKEGLPGNIVGAITEDAEGHMWIGHSMGFSRFDERSGRFLNFAAGPMASRLNIFVYGLLPISGERLLAATQCGPMIISRNGSSYTVNKFRDAQLSSQTTSAIEVAPGEIWYTCPLVGLYQAQAAGDSLTVTAKYFPGIDLRCLHLDEQDNRYLWIGSAKGLIRFDRKTRQYLVWGTAQGLANAYVYGILEDRKHNFWISTNGGLSFFDRQKGSFTNFTAADGLQSNEFNTNAWHRGRSGTFYFGGIKGFNWFDPASFQSERSKFLPQVALAAISVNDEPMLLDSALEAKHRVQLGYRQNNLAFRFAALDFTRPAANKIQYRLEGWDPAWVTTTNRTVRYASLPPGTYRLRVRSLNPDGLQSTEEDLTFVIAAPFWKRISFYIIVSLLVMIAVVMLTRSVTQRNIRRRLRALEQERALEAERNRISRDMHDEIGSGLTQIALLSELVQAQQRAEAELKRDVATISAQARKLVKSMGEIIWALNPQNATLESLLAYMREQAQEYFEPFEPELRIVFPQTIPEVELSNEQRRNLFLVVKEALHNALKHSAATEVELHLELQGELLRFSVRDNGGGISDRIRSGANGLRNMEKRMLDIGGRFSMQTGIRGTTVSFVLPITASSKRTLFARKNRSRKPRPEA